MAVSDKNILLSVNIITYNHEMYVAQAIEGVLMQKINFPYEIVICDDFSTDNTRNILMSYKNKFSELITLRFRDKNLGLKFNYFDNILACNGKYIAICEGDDYWTDSSKLQKQVDYLESNSDCSMCFHSALELHDYQGRSQTSNIFSNLENRYYSGSELLSSWLVPTASVIFRASSVDPIRFIDEFLFYDIVLFLKLAENGKIKCFNDVMSVYRRHDNSITNSNLSYLRYIHHLKYLDLELNGFYKDLIRKSISIEYFKRFKYMYKEKNKFEALTLLKSLRYSYLPIIGSLKNNLNKYI